MEVADRRAAVLQAIVEEYVQTAQPVASQTVAGSRALGVSSATVRNDMIQLERDGYIVQPHKSAGRIPTDRGYRFFVDHCTGGALAPGQRRVVSDFFDTAHSALEDLLHETSQMLARLTSHAAVVVGPQADSTRFRSVQLVSLQPRIVLAVAVLSNGAIAREVLTLASDASEAQVARASGLLDAALQARPAGELGVAEPSGDQVVDTLTGSAVNALAHNAETESELYVGGASRLAAEHEAFSTAQSAARLLEMLEEQVVVVSLVRDLLGQGVNVSIGTENEVDELRDCSLVLAPYRVEGQVAGTVGILGPTRMDYQQALAAVAAVSAQLGRLLLS